ncbi:YggT family protein [Parasulfuritortus cantonensis]|uniref:YggT family protein n=1 Tax=Parasulfuritortus cantonensis TaxID=2528202 RepID=A0A4R1B8Z9_9PROT|nr:YggT family protein [Parasulfuritortus cantonensis]TCJ12829.1 YggT family protein [Parasulfuritortus cantonensis]
MDANALFQVIQLILRLLIYTFIGKGLLALLAGPGYRDNAVWRFFEAVTRPAWRLTRTLAPRFVRDGAIAWLAVFLLILANLCLYMLFHYLGWLTPPRGAGPA